MVPGPRGTPPFFPDLLILRDFKSNVLEVHILQGLQCDFLELQNVKGLANNRMLRAGSRGEKRHRLKTVLLERATVGSRFVVENGREEPLPAIAAAGHIDFPLDAGDAEEKKLTDVGQSASSTRGDAIRGH